ncbi:MAG: CooT family nickel-binding protein [Pseudomonadota bacterium]
MCEAAAYLLKDGKEELLLESVDLLECRKDQVRVVSLFGEEKEVKGRVKALSLVDHKIIIEAL